MLKFKILIFFLILFVFSMFFYFDLGAYLNISFFTEKKQYLVSLYKTSPVLFVSVYFIFYIICATLSIPGAAVLTLLAGFLFHFLLGCLVVSLGSTIGATFAFLISRFLLRDWIQQKFKSKMETLNRGFKKNGIFYLFSLRLIPVFPFFAVNSLMGLTSIPVKHFFIASLVGMLPGTMVYVNAGSQLGKIESPKEIFSLSVFLSFLALALLPWVIKFLLKNFSYKKIAEKISGRPQNESKKDHEI